MKNISVWFRAKEPIAEVVNVNKSEVEVLMSVPCPAWADKKVVSNVLMHIANERNL